MNATTNRTTTPPAAGTAALTALTDPAAEAAIGAACRALHLPTIRAEATRIADVAARERLSHKAYLAEVLTRKPGAFAGATALVAARAAGTFTGVHQRFLDAARHRLGDGPGTRALVGVLLLHRTLTTAAVLAGIEAALILGSVDPDLVAVEARRSMLTQVPIPVVLPPGAVAAIPRPAPSLAGYDQLLREATA